MELISLYSKSQSLSYIQAINNWNLKLKTQQHLHLHPKDSSWKVESGFQNCCGYLSLHWLLLNHGNERNEVIHLIYKAKRQ